MKHSVINEKVSTQSTSWIINRLTIGPRHAKSVRLLCESASRVRVSGIGNRFGSLDRGMTVLPNY